MKSYQIMLNINTAKQLVVDIYNFESEIDLSQGRYLVNAKSIIGIFTLDLTRPITIEIHGTNEEEQNKLGELVAPLLTSTY